MKMTITENELVLISELRKTTVKLLSEDDYEKTNEFLIPWIRYKHNDVKKAEQALRNRMVWRRDNNLENILSEDMTEFETEWPMEWPGFDKDRCPVIGNRFNIDFRKYINCPGGKERYLRYVMKTGELGVKILRKQHYQTNGSVNDIFCIVDMDGYVFSQLTSPKIISMYQEFIKIVDDYYVGTIKAIYIINAAKILKILFDIGKKFMSEENFSRIKIFDSNKEQWRKALLEKVEEDQLPSFAK